MLYKEFVPLKEGFKTINISVTEIESALNPLPIARQISDNKKSANTFWVGNLAECIAWSTVSQWREAGLKQCDIVRSYMDKSRMQYFNARWVEDKQFQWFYDWLEQIVDLYEPWRWHYDMRSIRALCEIDYSWYKILLTGELDWGINGVHLFDNKTAKNKWDEDEKWNNACYQARFYSWFNMIANDKKEIDFTYLVNTKQKKMQLQEISRHIVFDEAEEFVKHKLYDYLSKLHSWELEHKTSSLERM